MECTYCDVFSLASRLDLDACKNRVRKARSMLGQQTVSVNISFVTLKPLISNRCSIIHY